MRRKLTDQARRNNRSMNAEILSILQIAVDRSTFSHLQASTEAGPLARMDQNLDQILDAVRGVKIEMAILAVSKKNQSGS